MTDLYQGKNSQTSSNFFGPNRFFLRRKFELESITRIRKKADLHDFSFHLCVT